MSLTEAYGGDYGLAEAAAVRKRQQQSIANQQAAFLGQQRGSRRMADINRQYIEGFRPKMAEYGRRGLAGPTVASGIQRSGLERYAANLQEQLGAETMSIQDQLNQIAMDEAQAQANLEDYVAQLRLKKQQDIINAASALKQYSSY